MDTREKDLRALGYVGKDRKYLVTVNASGGWQKRIQFTLTIMHGRGIAKLNPGSDETGEATCIETFFDSLVELDFRPDCWQISMDKVGDEHRVWFDNQVGFYLEVTPKSGFMPRLPEGIDIFVKSHLGLIFETHDVTLEEWLV